jgi:hypothetical protein
MRLRTALCLFVAAGFLTACSWFDSSNDNVLGRNDPDYAKRVNDPYHDDPDYDSNQDQFDTRGADVGTKNSSLISAIFGDSKGSANNGGGGGGGGPGIGVNSYLWRATLDTVSFMPLASADPFGGVIITDWYSPPDRPNERFKVNIFILGRELRADGVRASVFRQTRDPGGQWVDAAVDQKTGTDLENAILTRARQMRLSTASK